jgi:hypothetical protein
MTNHGTQLRKNIFHVAGRVFVEGACIPVVNPEMMRSVRFAIPTKPPKQMKRIM